MILNFRYHIFTITAIFAALGLGILIGTSIVGHEGIVEEQRRIIDNIGFDIKNLKKENNNLRDEFQLLEADLKYRQNIEKKIISLLIKDKLKENSYAIMTGNGINKNSQEELKNLLRTAGATPEFITTNSDLNLENKLILWKVNSEQLNGLSKEYKPLIYNQGDITGLLYNILKEELK